MVSLILGGICLLIMEVLWVKGGKGVRLNHKVNILNCPTNRYPYTEEKGIWSIEAKH